MHEAFSVDAQITISNDKGSTEHEAAVRVMGPVTKKRVLEACKNIYAKGGLQVTLKSFII